MGAQVEVLVVDGRCRKDDLGESLVDISAARLQLWRGDLAS